MNEGMIYKTKNEEHGDLEEFFKSAPNQRDILSEWNKSQYEPIDRELNYKERFRKNFGENNEYEYVIGTHDSKTGVEKITFELARNDSDISEFTFNKKVRSIDGKDEIVWDLEHRIAQTKNENISGTDIYNWVENYTQFLIKNGKIENHILFGEICQPKVMQWFLKNNYNITEDGSKLLDELNNSKSYSLIPVQIGHEDYKKDPFWIPSDIVNSEEIFKQKYNGEILKDKETQNPYLFFKKEIDPEKLGCPIIRVTKKIA